MISGFIAQKLNMSSIFLDNDRLVAVTRLHASPVKVTQVRDSQIEIAFGNKKFKSFPLLGPDKISVGDNLTIDQVFSIGDKVKVTGMSKGRGFAGVIKRWGFHRQPVTGGQSDRVRAPGAIGAQTPGKVVKGKKMPGHYGHTRKSVTGLKILAIDTDKNQITISGSIPGPAKSWVIIKKLTINT